MNPGVWEPPTGRARAFGAVLGGAMADVSEPDGEVGWVGSALLGLARGYSYRGGEGVPTSVAERHVGVHGPGWLAPVVVVRPDRSSRAADVASLAAAAGAEPSSLPALTVWVELAARLWRGQVAGRAVFAAGLAGGGGLVLCGDTAADAVAAGVWALIDAPAEGLDDPAARVAHVSARATPGVACSVAALLGFQLGAGVWPVSWHCHREAGRCGLLAAGLLRARSTRPDPGLRTSKDETA